jgi:hypothetical protein
VVSYSLRYFSSTSTEQISPIPPDLSPVSIRLALLFRTGAFVAHLLACLGLGLAWAYEADYFAMVFAAEAAFAGFEAVRRSL